MAIFVHCPYCHQSLTEMRQDCSHCGADLPPGILHALGLALGMPPPSDLRPGVSPPAYRSQLPPSAPLETADAESPVAHSPLRPWLAALLSLVCGLGQLYNGQTVKGIALIILGTAALVSVHLLIGKILVALLWTYAVADAYRVARRMNRHRQSPAS